MAAADITNCAICLETLDIPKYLPCLHTFCENCISTYMASSLKEESTSKIHCPVCRAEFAKPTENSTPAEWAKCLPMNFLVFGLLEKQKIERLEKECMSCERLDKTTPASFVCVECSDALCENCQQCHKANKLTCQHKTVPLKDLSEIEKSLHFIRYDCIEHKNEELKLFCVDHNVPCCSLCVSVSHRKCNEVITIEQAAEKVVSSDFIRNIRKTLEEIYRDASKIIDHNNTYKDQLDSNFDSTVEKLDKFCQEFVSKIDMFKQKQKDKLTKLMNEKKEEIETNIVTLENLKRKVENKTEVLSVCMKKATAVQVLIETKKINEKQTEDKNTILSVYQKSPSYKFLLECKKDVACIIQILENDNSVSCDQKPCNLELDTVPLVTLNPKITQDLGPGVIDCIAYQDKIVGLYKDNNTLFVFRIEGIIYNSFRTWSTYMSRQYGRGTATLIAEGYYHNNESEILVYTSQKDGAVEFSDTEGYHRSHMSTGITNATCMLFHQEKQAVILESAGFIYVFNRSGKKNATNNAGPSKLITIDSQSRLYFVDSNKISCKTIEFIDLKTITIEDITDISGFILDNRENIYVTHGKAVIRISPSGNHTSIVLNENVGYSSLVRINRDNTVFLVINNDNRQWQIRVYDCSYTCH